MTLKTSQIASANTVSSSDKFVLVRDTNGTKITRLGTVADIVTKATPANSTITIAAGSLFVDADYLYVATSANVLKRIPLTSF
jgi:hypothetical protein